jgi:uncharacterized protein (UPF0276 family)
MTNSNNRTRNSNTETSKSKQFFCIDYTPSMLLIMEAINNLKIDGSKKDEKETMEYLKQGIETIIDKHIEEINSKAYDAYTDYLQERPKLMKLMRIDNSKDIRKQVEKLVNDEIAEIAKRSESSTK